MVSLTRHQIPALILALVGLSVAIYGVQAVPHPGESEYIHSVYHTPVDRIPSEADVINHSALSPTGQSVFVEALQSNDEVVLYGESNKLPDFSYPDVQSSYHEMNYISYQGEYYQLYTLKVPSSHEIRDFAFLGGHLLIGGSLIGIALLGRIGDQGGELRILVESHMCR